MTGRITNENCCMKHESTLGSTNWHIHHQTTNLQHMRVGRLATITSSSIISLAADMMATSKNSQSLSPLVVFLLGAASATVLLLFVLTATARPAWPALETGLQRSGEAPGSGSVRCSTPRANGTVAVAAEQHTGVRAPPANEVTQMLLPCSFLDPSRAYTCLLGQPWMIN